MPDSDGFLTRWSRRKVQAQQGLGLPDSPQPASPKAVPALAVQPPVADVTVPAPAIPATAGTADADAADAADHTAPAAPPAPTLEEAQRLTTADDFSRFVGRNVDPQVKHTALRTLFSDPHFNVMDGLDTYIDDYGKPDPLPPGMLRQMVQSSMLGLFDDEPTAPAKADADADPSASTQPAAGGPPEPAHNPAHATEATEAATQAAAPVDTTAPPPSTPLATPSDEDIALRLQPHDATGPAGDRAGALQDAWRQH